VTLLALRPYLPLAPAVLAGNAAMAGCGLMMLRGVALHLQQPLPLWRPLLMAAAFMACIFAFLVLAGPGMRLQVFSVFALMVDGWIAGCCCGMHRPAAHQLPPGGGRVPGRGCAVCGAPVPAGGARCR
jgi:hypothetical protein